MNRLEALKKSRDEKWMPIAAGTGADGGMDDCVLCQKYCPPPHILEKPAALTLSILAALLISMWVVPPTYGNAYSKNHIMIFVALGGILSALFYAIMVELYEVAFGCCRWCPVAAHTGQKRCMGSPYQVWDRHQEEAHPDGDYSVQCEQCKRLADDMVAFLNMLIEKGPVHEKSRGPGGPSTIRRILYKR